MLSSDEEAPITSVSRPRQRSLRRRKFCLTDTPTSEQLVSHLMLIVFIMLNKMSTLTLCVSPAVQPTSEVRC